jgi:DNA-binding MurR/RpiR family transcriptional regulator
VQPDEVTDLTPPGAGASANIDDPEGNGRALLTARIHAKRASMSRKQRGLAEYFLDHPATVAFATANEIGDHSGASGATVVRFAQLLGYEGFSELRESLQTGLLPFATFEEQLASLAEKRVESPSDLTRLVFAYERENLEATAAMLSPDSVVRAAEVIATAGRTILIGEGVGGAVAQLLANQLTRLGLSVLVPHDPVHAVITLANAQPDDVVFGVTFWRFSRSTNDLLVTAKSRGASTIAVVDSPLFPAADFVDHLLIVRSRNAGQGPSATAAITVANLVVCAVILADFPRFSAAIEQIDEAYSTAHLYVY